MLKHTNSALHRDITLLIISLTSSRDPVGVTTLPAYTMLLPVIKILVRLKSDFWGRTSQTTLLNEIYFLRLTVMFSCLTTKKVSEPATRYFLGPSLPLPTPWYRIPSSFVYDCFHISLSLGWLRSWRHLRIFPDYLSKTGMAQFSINSYG